MNQTQSETREQDTLEQDTQEHGGYGALLARMRSYFSGGTTRDVAFRLAQLKALKTTLVSHEAELFDALKKDLGKCAMEAYTTEFGFVVGDIDHTIKHLKRWTRPQRVMAPPVLFPASGMILQEPRGVVLVIGAWNYPLQLTISPLIAAISAGNCVVVKPSEVAEHTATLVSKLLKEAFAPDFVSCVEGGVNETTELLREKFDHIFFTGSTQIGRVIYEAAAQQLTPVTLELGGKSPCFVDGGCRMDVAARRITWGKFVNAGQTCVAPDYVLVERSALDRFVAAMKRAIQEFYGSDPSKSPDLGRIVNDRHFQRLSSMLPDGEILFGGETDASSRYIAPTLISNIQPESRLLTDEIFGPLLPIIAYGDLTEAIQYVNSRPHPLALYVFAEDSKVSDRVLRETTSGGACVNDAVVQLGLPELPFGGIGNSGIGAYHGRHGFDTFSHARGVLKNPTALDVKLRYPPYKDNLKLIRRLM